MKALQKIFLFVIPFIFSSKAYAMCPVCTIAVGSTLVLLEKYGVDNTISGLWIGGLVVSASMWLINWLRKRDWSSPITEYLIFIFFYASTIAPFYSKNIIGISDKTIWGMDKILFGMGIGSIVFYFGGLVYQIIKKRNGGHAHFPFEKVIVPVSPLLLLSVLFWLITKK